MAAFYPGGIVRLPHGIQAGPINDYVSQMQYSEVRYDYNTDSYRTSQQDEEIRKLRTELEEKKETRKQEVSQLIGYFYKRR